jgi:hypothetical protein
MGTVNNIFNVKINNVTSTGSVNFGNTIHIGHEANSKAMGGAYQYGDLGRMLSASTNKSIDPDIIDQP